MKNLNSVTIINYENSKGQLFTDLTVFNSNNECVVYETMLTEWDIVDEYEQAALAQGLPKTMHYYEIMTNGRKRITTEYGDNPISIINNTPKFYL